MKRDTHILKIVNNDRTFSTDIGVKCFPAQTYGISQEAPTQFKGQHSLIGQNGYIYKYDDEEQKNPEIVFSQRKYCSVLGNTIDVVDDFKEKYDEGFAQQPNIFRRRKGRLTEFMDKNGWMNKVYKMMGDERTDQARQSSNKDRQMRINSLKPKKLYNNPVALKPLPKQNFPTISLISQKAKIRQKRYSLHSQKRGDLNIQRSLDLKSPQEEQDVYLDAEVLTNKMASTLHDKDWRTTMSSIRRKHSPSKRSQANNSRAMNLTCEDWSKNYKVCEVKEESRDQLKDWFNSTCNSNADRWKFRKPKKMDTQSSQQINGPQN